jgi:hypothetical protein
MPVTSPELRLINSTSYVDVVALYMGLNRLEGEDSISFLDRMYRASVSRRDHSFQGAINELNLDLGLKVQSGISITYTGPGDLLITADIRGLRLFVGNDVLDVTIPIVVAATDDVWEWRLLSQVVEDLNNVDDIEAVLLIEDGAAVQVVRQSNIQTVFNEPVAGSVVKLQNANLVPGSERFNRDVVYTLNPVLGRVSLPSPPVGLTISYQYLTLPYEVVCAEGSMIGLMDRNVSSAFLNDSRLIHQVRETVQSVMKLDRSYWSK